MDTKHRRNWRLPPVLVVLFALGYLLAQFACPLLGLCKPLPYQTVKKALLNKDAEMHGWREPPPTNAGFGNDLGAVVSDSLWYRRKYYIEPCVSLYMMRGWEGFYSSRYGRLLDYEVPSSFAVALTINGVFFGSQYLVRIDPLTGETWYTMVSATH